MGAAHRWGGRVFATETQVEDSGAVREQVDFAHPGVDGVESIDKGWRGRFVTIRGRHAADSLEALLEWITAMNNDVRNGVAALTLYDAEVLDYCELYAFSVPLRRRTHDGKYACRYVAAFRQKRKNDEA